MRKKILCVAMTVIMAVGTLVGCGSSSGGTSKKVEESIMTQIIPGESTADELEKYLQDKGVTWENDKNGKPEDCTNTDYFLGHEAQFFDFDYYKDTIYEYQIQVAFKDVNDYKTGLNEIKEYFEKMGTGITGYNDDEGADKEPIKCYLLEDETDYYTAVMPWTKTIDDNNYYNTTIVLYYYRVDKNNEAGETVLWKDKDGNSYITKFDKANGKSVNSIESKESINMPVWKQAYIDYINGLKGKVDGYQFVDINSDGQPELVIWYEYNETEGALLNYTKSGNIQPIPLNICGALFYSDNKCMQSVNWQGKFTDCVYAYNSSTGEFDKIFYGEYDYNSNTGISNNYSFGIQGLKQTTKEEYESKLKEAKGNIDFVYLEYQIDYDIDTALQNCYWTY